jgi:hypothetical protein
LRLVCLWSQLRQECPSHLERQLRLVCLQLLLSCLNS